MIYDLIPYCGERNILNLRLHELSDIVDKFVILEGEKSHTRIAKPPEFDIKDFPGFEDRIEYFSFDYCIHDNPFYNDEQGRICLYEKIKKTVTDSDLILAGDLDEIPDINSLCGVIQNYKMPTTLLMKNRVLCADLEQTGVKFPGTSILHKRIIESTGLNNLRNNRQNSHYKFFRLVEDAGWHLTYCSGLNRVLNKMKFFAHAPETGAWAKTEEELIQCIKTKTSLDKETKLNKIKFDSKDFPCHILSNKEQYMDIFSFNYV